MEDASLSDFGRDDEASEDGDAAASVDDETSADDEASEALEQDDAADAAAAVEPAVETAMLAEGVCADCGETVGRRWRTDWGLVCGDCMDW